MADKYYTPTIDEFKQGFKFEKLVHCKGEKLGSLFYLDEEYNKEHGCDVVAEEDKWVEVVVFWDREPEFKTIQYDNIEVSYKEFPIWDWQPWINSDYITNLIKDGKVRARR